MSHPRAALITFVLGLLWVSVPANAQPLGTFRWQIQPYCNVLTLTVVQQGGNFTLDGTDDRCGLSRLASAVGIAYFNPNGSVSFGLTEVMPGGLAIHMDATIDVSSLNGTWRDSGGSAGSLIFTPGAGIGGPLRSVPSAGVAPGSITGVQLANGAVGAPAIATNAITGGNVLDGSLTRADIGDAPRAAFASGDQIVTLTAVDTPVRSVTIVAPAAGRVIVNASGMFILDYDSGPTISGVCEITTEASAHDFTHTIAAAAKVTIFTPFAGTRGFDVTAGSTTTFNLICFEENVVDPNKVRVADTSLTAMFVPGS